MGLSYLLLLTYFLILSPILLKLFWGRKCEETKVSLKCHSFSSVVFFFFLCMIYFLFLFVCVLFMVVFLKIIFNKGVLLYSAVGNHFSFSGLE